MKPGKSIALKILAALLFCIFPATVFSQATTSCAENLKSAQSLFQKGQVSEVAGMISGCMKSGFKREEQIAAYKLLIQSYLFEDKTGKADSAMLSFLERYPEYQLSPTDHSSFEYLYNSYKVRPILQLTLHAGLNLPYLTLVTQQTVSSEPVKGSYSSNLLNFYISAEARYTLIPKLDLCAEIGISVLKFANYEEFLHFGTVYYSETQKRLEIPLSVTYDLFRLGKVTSYARLGLGTAFDLNCTARASFTPYDQSNSETHTGADLSRNDSRIFMDIFAQAGFGIKYKTPLGYISLEARLNNGFLNQVKKSGSNTYFNYEGGIRDLKKTSSAEELKYRYYYLDDAFNLGTLNISLGYTQIFYKPSKRK
jgi:hypothetical protein